MTTGIRLPLLSRSSDSRSGLASLAKAGSSTARSNSPALQRAPGCLDRIDRYDIRNFAELAINQIIFVDMKDSGTFARRARDRLRKQPHERVEIYRFAQPVQDIELG